MKLKFTIIIFFCLFICININKTFANNYKKEIENLQKQIDDLNIKLERERQSNKNTESLKRGLENLTINGRIHIDGKWYSKDDSLEDDNKYNDKFSIRRARLSVNKQINNFIFNFEGNFNNDKARLGNTFLGYQINDSSKIYFGQYTAPGFIEREKSSNTMSFIEYNSIVKMDWNPFYYIGINYSFKNDYLGFSTGFFGNGTDDENSIKNDTYYNSSSRLFYTPLRSKDYTVHLGLNSIYQKYKTDIESNPDYINYTYTYGGEIAIGYKNLSFTNEFIKSIYSYKKENFDGNKFNFNAFSSEIVLNITGEKQKYNDSGYFSIDKIINPLSKGGHGAFQLASRYSYANGKDISGGYLNNIGSHYDYSFALNWLPEDHIMILFNYSKNKITTKNYEEKGKYDLFTIEMRMFF